MNATERAQRFRIQAQGLPGMVVEVAPALQVDPAAARWVPVAVRVSPDAAATAGPGSHVIHFVVELSDAPAAGAAAAADGAGGATGSPASPVKPGAVLPSATVTAVQEKSTFIVPR
jgi:hypothetical protein